MTRKEFMKEAHLDKTWNRINSFNGINIGTVLWQDKPWKLVSTTDFNSIKDRENKTFIIKEFRLQEELWQYVKSIN